LRLSGIGAPKNIWHMRSLSHWVENVKGTKIYNVISILDFFEKK